MDYQIFTDATADVIDSLMVGLPYVEVIPMQVHIYDQEFTYGPEGNLSIAEFYKMLREGEFASTTQINPSVYCQYFERALKEGKDVLYLCFSSGMSSTFQSSQIAAQELLEKYPERKILCVDTLGATTGMGLLVHGAAKLQSEGKSIEEVAAWIEENRLKVCYWVIVDTFDHLRHGGRVSGATAAAGTVLQIKPMLHIDEEGHLVNTAKPRGHKRALAAILEKVQSGFDPAVSNVITIAHGDCMDYALELKESILAVLPDAQITINDLGPVIGAHTGPGLLAAIYFGSNR